MNQDILNSITSGSAFCIYAQNKVLTLAVGEIQRHNYLAHLPRRSKAGLEKRLAVASISMVPFSQIKERKFEVADEGEKIICLVPHDITTLTSDELVSSFGCDRTITLEEPVTYNFSDEEFAEIVAKTIDEEIKNGAGSNFLISRKLFGKLGTIELEQALTIFYRLVNNEFGAYMTFCFFDGQRYFIGASPERHLTIQDGIARMNPICGTLPKNNPDMRAALEAFVQDEKEINELFMVVDETLKMMMPICPEGGEVSGPFLKEMRSLIHTENELRGKTEWDVIDAFRSTMFAPTMVGSPIESASRVIYKHERGHSRRYYSSTLLLLGDESEAAPFLDSAITIRTIELAKDGRFVLQAGASIVRDSIPEKEAAEVRAKSLGLLKAISTKVDESPILDKLYDQEVARLLIARNERLSSFWIDEQVTRSYSRPLMGKTILLINNEDDFVYMAAHLLQRMGAVVTVKDIKEIGGISSIGNVDLVILGPGPGDPTDSNNPKIRTLHRLTKSLFQQRTFALYGICLGHQIICHQLGLPISKLPVPCQGVQRNVDIFGTRRRLGFYNTFSARSVRELPADVYLSTDENAFVTATRGTFFGSIQAHPESVLSKDGYAVLADELTRLLC